MRRGLCAAVVLIAIVLFIVWANQRWAVKLLIEQELGESSLSSGAKRSSTWSNVWHRISYDINERDAAKLYLEAHPDRCSSVRRRAVL